MRVAGRQKKKGWGYTTHGKGVETVERGKAFLIPIGSMGLVYFPTFTTKKSTKM